MTDAISNPALRRVDPRDPPVRTLGQVPTPPPLILDPPRRGAIARHRLRVELLPADGRRQPVRVNGVAYGSCSAAGAATGLHVTLIRRMAGKRK